MRLTVVDPARSARDQRRDLMTNLQAVGFRMEADTVDGSGARSRRGGAGPTDHKAVTIDGQTLMVPVHTGLAQRSPFVVKRKPASNQVHGDGKQAFVLEHEGQRVAEIRFPKPPRFYGMQTLDGIPYWKLATLHSADVLATTVMQRCIRYQPAETACQFCAIGQSLKGGRTIARKTPEQLAEVARAAVRLDGVKHMIMTTGTPNHTDRGAGVLAESAFAVKRAVNLPIQAQCEPPDDFAWFERMKDAGVDSLGMHLEAVEPHVRAKIMPGKAEVPVEVYMDAFAEAVSVFGWGQVSTYILAGLGDSHEAIVEMSGRLIDLGVYPFVVPFVPISGTALADHPGPDPHFMQALLADVGAKLYAAGMNASQMKAGCGKCGACSSLSQYEAPGTLGNPRTAAAPETPVKEAGLRKAARPSTDPQAVNRPDAGLVAQTFRREEEYAAFL